MQINPGTSSSIRVLGGTGPFTASLSAPVASAQIDEATETVSLAARANGVATLTVSDSAGATVSASILVAPSAGFVPAAVTVSLVGNPGRDYIAEQIRAALVRSAHLLPGARLTAADAAPENGMRPGERLEVPVRVHLDGVARYVDVDGIANVHVVTGAAARDVPVTLFYSDDPEKLRTDGVLFSGTVSEGRPIRLYYYHQAVTAGHEVAILLDSPTGAAVVSIVGQGAGPNAAVMFVGQSATLRYLDDRARGAGVALDVPVGAPVVLFTGDRPLAAGDLVAGILDVSVTDGDPVRVTVMSLPEGADGRPQLGSAELPSDGKRRRGEYDLSPPAPLVLDYRLGDAAVAVTVGALSSALQNRRPGGHVLAGDYGVYHALDLHVINPASVPATVYLYEQPIGFPVTTTLAFDGDPAPMKVECVKNAAKRYLVRAFGVPANGDEHITGGYMTDGGSTYPLTFGLTDAEPEAPPTTMTSPDGCFPKKPTPVTTPPS